VKGGKPNRKERSNPLNENWSGWQLLNGSLGGRKGVEKKTKTMKKSFQFPDRTVRKKKVGRKKKKENRRTE